MKNIKEHFEGFSMISSSFRITDVLQVSKNRYLCTIAGEDHHEVDGRFYTRPRQYEIVSMFKDGAPIGSFFVLKKYNQSFPHEIVVRKATGGTAPKCRGVEYRPFKMVVTESTLINKKTHD